MQRALSEASISQQFALHFAGGNIKFYVRQIGADDSLQPLPKGYFHLSHEECTSFFRAADQLFGALPSVRPSLLPSPRHAPPPIHPATTAARTRRCQCLRGGRGARAGALPAAAVASGGAAAARRPHRRPRTCYAFLVYALVGEGGNDGWRSFAAATGCRYYASLHNPDDARAARRSARLPALCRAQPSQELEPASWWSKATGCAVRVLLRR